MERQFTQRKISLRLPVLSPRGVQVKTSRPLLQERPQERDPFYAISRESKFRGLLRSPSSLQSKQGQFNTKPSSTTAQPLGRNSVGLRSEFRLHCPSHTMSLMIPDIEGIEVTQDRLRNQTESIVRATFTQRGGAISTCGFRSSRRTASLIQQAKSQR